MAGRERSNVAVWISRLFHITLVVGLAGLIIVQAWGSLVAPHLRQGADADGKKRQSRLDTSLLHNEARAAYESKSWAESAQLYERLLKMSPDDFRARVCYAYSLHQSGDVDEAIRAYVLAMEYDRAKAWAMFNLSRLYMQKGMRQRALDCLTDAVDCGYRPQQPVRQLSEFAPIIGDPEFENLADRLQPALEQSIYRRLDFLLGSWDVLDGNDARIGGLVMTSNDDGFTLHGQFQGDGDDSATLMYFFDPGENRWTRIRVDANGTVERTHSTSMSAQRIEFQGERVRTDGTRHKCTIVILPARYGRVDETIEVSYDGASTLTEFSGTLVRTGQ